MVILFNDDKCSSSRERIGVSVAVAGLGLVALIWLGLLGRVLLQAQAGGDRYDTVASAEQCVSIADNQVRLRCYDQESHHPEQWPAKGAPAPLLFYQPKAAPQPR
jgi:hypothetical protein